MAFQHRYRLSTHAVITDDEGRVLLLKASYADGGWGLPGGGVDPGESLHETLARECQEELGCEVVIDALTGVYYHASFEAHAVLFRCRLPDGAVPKLSEEHTEYRYFPVEELSPVQRLRVEDCLGFDGRARSRSF